MFGEVFKLFGTIGLNTDEAERGVDSVTGKAKSAGSKIGGYFKKAAVMIGGVFAAGKLIEFGGTAIKAAAEAQAIGAQFEQVFGDIQTEAQGVIDRMSETFGMLPNRLKPAYTQSVSMFKGLGLDTEDAMMQAERAVTAAADAAAFYDKSYEDANSALGSFIKGNYEGGESIGLFANETQLAAYAAKNGIENFSGLEEAQKQIIRLDYAEAMLEAGGATGQAARESDAYENQIGNLKQAWQDFKALVGAPILDTAVAGLTKAAEWTELAGEKVKQFQRWFGELKAEVADSTAWNSLKDVIQIGLDKFNEFKAGLDGTGAFDRIKETLTQLKDVILEIDFREVLTQVQEFLDKWGPLIAGIVAGIATFKLLMGTIALVKTAMAGLAAIKHVIVGFKTAVAVFGGVKAAAAALIPIMTGVSLPILGIVAAVAAAVTAGVLLWKNWDTVKAKFVEFDTAVRAIAQRFKDKVIEIFWQFDTKVREIVTGFRDKAVELFWSFDTKAREIATGFRDKVVQIFWAFDTKVREIVTGFRDKVVEIFRSFDARAREIATGFRDKVVEIFRSFDTRVREIASATREQVVSIFSNLRDKAVAIFTSIRDRITSIFTSIQKTATTIWNGIKNVINTVWTFIRTIITNYLNNIRTAVSTVFNFIRSTITTIMNVVRNAISTAWNFIRSIFSSGTSAIRSVTSSAFNFIRSTITTIINGVRNTISSVLNSIRNTFSNIFNGLRSIVSGAFSKVRSAVSSGMSGALSTVTGFLSRFKTAGSNIIGNIASGIRSSVKKVTDAVGGVLQKARNLLPFSPPKDKSSPMAGIEDNGIMDQIAKGIYNSKDKLDQALRSVMPDADDLQATAKINAVSNGTIRSSAGSTFAASQRTISQRQEESRLQTFMDDFRGAIKDLTNQPILVQVEGRTIAVATRDPLDEELGYKERDRNYNTGRRPR